MFCWVETWAAMYSSDWKLRKEMIAMKLKGRVMNGRFSCPRELWRALDIMTLQSTWNIIIWNIEIKNLANDPKQTATQRWASLLDTRLKREGRTVPSRDPLNDATPEFHMDWGWRPRMSSVRVAMRPPSAQPRPAWTWPSKMETRMRRPRKGLLTNIV